MRVLGLSILLLCACTGGGLPTGGDPGDPSNGGDGGTRRTCGGLTGARCGANEWCDFPANAACGAADQTGVCKPRPQVCPELYAPVCGCDGRTHESACHANAGGIDVAYAGPCKTMGQACGGWAEGSCGPNEYCHFTPGQYCDWADGSGTCKPRPQGCDLRYDPVCGCDGKTYGNECAAASAGQGTAYQGECGNPQKDCRTTGCAPGLTCQLCWTTWECLDDNTAC